jgi:hypothetical protein
MAFNWRKHDIRQESPKASEEGSKMKVNKSYVKNYPSAGRRFLILLGALALSLPYATEGHYIHPLGHAEPVKVPNAIDELAPLIGTVVSRATPGLSPVSSADASEQSGSPDILIDASLGDAQIVLERGIRKTGNNTLKYLVIRLKDGRVISFTSSQRIGLRAMLVGANADQGSLPYTLAWLAGNPDPLGSVRALGYDIEVVKEHERPCTDQLPSQACVNLARRLATLIDATLGFGSPEERAQFRRDASAIGIAPDCSPQEP